MEHCTSTESDALAQAEQYIQSHPDPKRAEMRTLHDLALKLAPGCRVWFSDGKDDTGKIVSNPSIGYGQYTIRYANGSEKEFFTVGISANSSGISVYIMGLDDKSYLSNTFGATIGKAKVTGYCIAFKTLADIDLDVLAAAMKHGFERS
jgi:hypothetical protein